MKRLFDSFVGLLAEFVEADTVVLYREGDQGRFSPVSYFSLRDTELVLDPFDLEESENLVVRVIKEWSPYITSDTALIEEMGVPYYQSVIPRVFMAVPFKLGRDRAVLCMDSSSLGAFSEKQQKLVESSIKVIKEMDLVGSRLLFSRIPEAKSRLLMYTSSVFSEYPFDEAFVRWCAYMGVDLGAVLLGGDDFEVVADYRGREELEDLDLKLPARSVVRLAYERQEVYCLDDVVPLFEGYEAYGIVAPWSVGDMKGVLVLGSGDGDFFTDQVSDVIEGCARIMGLALYAEGERESGAYHLVEPLELENRLRILTSRAKKEGRILAILLFTVRHIDKEYAKRGFWKVEEIMNNIFKRAQTVVPLPEVICRVSDNALVLGRIFDTEEEAVEYKKGFNTSTAELVDFKDCYTDLLIYPSDASNTEELMKAIGERVVKSKKKGWI